MNNTQEIKIEEWREHATARSDHYLYHAGLVWNFALLSLPLDLFILWAGADLTSELTGEAGDYTSTIFTLLIVGLILTGREKLFSLTIRGLNYIRRDTDNLRRFAYGIAAFFGLIALGHLGYLFFTQGIVPVVVPAIIYGSTIASIIGSTGNLEERLAAPEQTTFEKEFFYLIIGGILIGRGISLTGCLVAIFSGMPYLTYGLFLIASLFLLLDLQPTKELFQTTCKGCAKTTSRAAQLDGICVACQRNRSAG